MVNNRRTGGRRNRRRRGRPRRGRRTSLPQTGILRAVRSAIRNVQPVKSITLYPKQIGTSGSTETSWLDTLSNLGTYAVYAMKLFGTLLASSGLDAGSVAITSSVQSIPLGAEDLINEHPIVEITNVNNKDFPYLEYEVAKINWLRVVISLMGPMSERAGRLAALLVPLTREQAIEIRDGVGGISITESVTFENLIQMPGVVVGQINTPMTIRYSPRSPFTRSYVEIGDRATPQGTLAILGGLPLFKLMIGYQDLAANKADPTLTFSLAEATICIEIQSSIDLAAPTCGIKRLIRPTTKSLMSPANITLKRGFKTLVDVPIDHIKRINGVLKLTEDSQALADEIGFMMV